MTKSILAVLSVLLFSTLAFAGDPPAAVQKAFEQKFPGVAKVKWNKENASEYEATFKLNGTKCSANFSNSGEWLETETELAFKQLPDKVKKAFNSNYIVGSVKGAAKIETAKGTIKYEVESKPGYKPAEVFYNEDGTEVNGR